MWETSNQGSDRKQAVRETCDRLRNKRVHEKKNDVNIYLNGDGMKRNKVIDEIEPIYF